MGDNIPLKWDKKANLKQKTLNFLTLKWKIYIHKYQCEKEKGRHGGKEYNCNAYNKKRHSYYGKNY